MPEPQPDIDAPDGDQRPRGGEAFPAAAFGVAIVGIIGFVAVYFAGADTQALGVFAFLGLAGIGTGLASWARRFLTPA